MSGDNAVSGTEGDLSGWLRHRHVPMTRRSMFHRFAIGVATELVQRERRAIKGHRSEETLREEPETGHSGRYRSGALWADIHDSSWHEADYLRGSETVLWTPEP